MSIDTTHYAGWHWVLAVIRKWWLYYLIWAAVAAAFVIWQAAGTS